MLDDDAKDRRELIFDKYRNVSAEVKDLDKQFTVLRETRNDKNEERRRLNRLIKIMLHEDCCPVMAQLKYDEEINANKRNSGKSLGVPNTSYDEDDYDDDETCGEGSVTPCPPRSPRNIKKTIKRKLINLIKRI